MPLPAGIVQRIAAHFEREYAGVNRMPIQRAAQEIADEERVREQLRLMARCIGEPLGGKRVLEVGSGIGLLQAAARIERVDAVGIEPDAFNCDVTREVLRSYRLEPAAIARAVGERLPFHDDTFDVVCSFLVLEHVRNVRAVMSEAVRVLKRGGFLHFVAPNYGSIWEGHYNIVWPPNSPAWLAKLYVRLLGREARFVDTLQLLTPRLIRRILKELPLEVKSLGADTWAYRLDTLDFSEWSELKKLKMLVRLARRLHLIRLVRWAGLRLDLFTPIIITARKRDEREPRQPARAGLDLV